MLTESQMKAAKLFVYKDITKMRVEDIAKECGISVPTLYKWKQEKEFIKFQTVIAEERMEDFLTTCYEEIRDMATNKKSKDTTKLKALELVLRNRGRLRDKQEITMEVSQKSNEELESEIEEMISRTRLD
jgi:AcrR family transcriptional regulator